MGDLGRLAKKVVRADGGVNPFGLVDAGGLC
jgi:hypothetical protein